MRVILILGVGTIFFILLNKIFRIRYSGFSSIFSMWIFSIITSWILIGLVLVRIDMYKASSRKMEENKQGTKIVSNANKDVKETYDYNDMSNILDIKDNPYAIVENIGEEEIISFPYYEWSPLPPPYLVSDELDENLLKNTNRYYTDFNIDTTKSVKINSLSDISVIADYPDAIKYYDGIKYIIANSNNVTELDFNKLFNTKNILDALELIPFDLFPNVEFFLGFGGVQTSVILKAPNHGLYTVNYPCFIDITFESNTGKITNFSGWIWSREKIAGNYGEYRIVQNESDIDILVDEINQTIYREHVIESIEE